MTSPLPPLMARLPADERLALIGALWDSLDDSEVPLTDAQRMELDRRLAALNEDRDRAVSWDVLKAELRSRRP